MGVVHFFENYRQTVPQELRGMVSLSCTCICRDFVQSSKTWWAFQNTYELVNLIAPKFSFRNKLHIIQCMGKVLCVEVQSVSLRFLTNYLILTLKDTILYNWKTTALRFKPSYAFRNSPWWTSNDLGTIYILQCCRLSTRPNDLILFYRLSLVWGLSGLRVDRYKVNGW